MSVQELKVRQKDMDKLSPKMRKFLGEYLITYEPMNSAIAAGYSKKTAAVMAQKLLKHPIISKYISAAEKKSQDDYELTRYEIIEQLAYCVLRVGKDFVDENNKLLPIREMSPRAQACIDGFEQEVTILRDMDGNEIGEKIKTKIKLVPKASAMDMAMKHKGLFAAEKHEVNGKVSMQHEFPFAKLMGAGGPGIEEDEVEKLIEAEGRVISEVPDD